MGLFDRASVHTEYRTWTLTATYSGTLGAGPAGVAHARYVLMGSQAALREPVGWRSDRLHMGPRIPPSVPHPDYLPRRGERNWRAPPPDPCAFSLSFTGASIGGGAPASLEVATPRHGFWGRDIWTPEPYCSASRFEGIGNIVDLSLAAILGCQVQLLIFRTVGRSSSSLAGILAESQALAELVDAMLERRITRLRDLFPAAALTWGVMSGFSYGVNLYEGIWNVCERDI